VKRLAFCYRTVVLSVCPVCDVGCIVAKRLNGLRCHLVQSNRGRPRRRSLVPDLNWEWRSI